jgi:hypothetical protein
VPSLSEHMMVYQETSGDRFGSSLATRIRT